MLLNRAQTREARAALEALSRRFLALGPSSVADPSLASGLAGVALVHAALDVAFPGAGHDARAQRTLARAMDLITTTPLGPSLFSGFTGIAWVAEVLAGDPSAAPEDDPIAAVDRALEASLARARPDQPYDLVEGTAGVGVYALERMPRSSAKRMLALVVERLTAAVRLRKKPRATWNLGVAHGVPGVIAVLGRIAAADVGARAKKGARALLEEAVTWLLAQELPQSAEGRFAHAVGPGIPREPTRLAWCYGDAGIAAALLVAARAAGAPAWEGAAMRIALHAAARTETTSGVRDAGLCHGAAGVAHVFHRLHRVTGEARLAAAARTWFERALAMRKPGRGFGGFSAYDPAAEGSGGWRGRPDFLTGAGGVTLSLLAATTDVDPVWDRALLLS